MPRSFAARVGICGAFCLAVLVTMLVRHAWPLWTGDTIYLTVRPIDPRDLFRGDYVTLSYDLDVLHVNQSGVRSGFDDAAVTPVGAWWDQLQGVRRPPTELYVQLRVQAGTTPGAPQTYVPVSISDRPEPDAVNLRGRVVSFWSEAQASYRFTMDYGIGAFYVQEGTGKPIEQAIRARSPVFAEIAVTRSGRARVRDLIVNGRRGSRPQA